MRQIISTGGRGTAHAARRVRALARGVLGVRLRARAGRPPPRQLLARRRGRRARRDRLWDGLRLRRERACVRARASTHANSRAIARSHDRARARARGSLPLTPLRSLTRPRVTPITHERGGVCVDRGVLSSVRWGAKAPISPPRSVSHRGCVCVCDDTPVTHARRRPATRRRRRLDPQVLPVPELLPFRLTPQFTNLLRPLDSVGLLKVHYITSYYITLHYITLPSRRPRSSGAIASSSARARRGS